MAYAFLEENKCRSLKCSTQTRPHKHFSCKWENLQNNIFIHSTPPRKKMSLFSTSASIVACYLNAFMVLLCGWGCCCAVELLLLLIKLTKFFFSGVNIQHPYSHSMLKFRHFVLIWLKRGWAAWVDYATIQSTVLYSERGKFMKVVVRDGAQIIHKRPAHNSTTTTTTSIDATVQNDDVDDDDCDDYDGKPLMGCRANKILWSKWNVT